MGFVDMTVPSALPIRTLECDLPTEMERGEPEERATRTAEKKRRVGRTRMKSLSSGARKARRSWWYSRLVVPWRARGVRVKSVEGVRLSVRRR